MAVPVGVAVWVGVWGGGGGVTVTVAVVGGGVGALATLTAMSEPRLDDRPLAGHLEHRAGGLFGVDVLAHRIDPGIGERRRRDGPVAPDETLGHLHIARRVEDLDRGALGNLRVRGRAPSS